jgi:glutaredoxin 3
VRASAGDLEAQIKSTVAESKVVVYSKSWCPFCLKTKALLDSMGVEYKAVELDELDDGAAIQEALLGLTKQRTVPNVFVGGAHLGGNDDTQRAAADGRLQEMLK